MQLQPLIRVLGIGFFLTLYGLTSFASETTALSLKQALNKSLELNLGLSVSALGDKEKKAQVLKEEGAFDLNLKFSYKIDRDITPSSSVLDGVDPTEGVKTRNVIYSTSFQKRFSFGTQLELPYSYTVSESNSSYNRFSPSHSPSLTFKLTQPLVKGLTPSYFRKDLERAELDSAIASNEHQQKIIDTASKTLELYLGVLKAQETLKIKQTSLTTAEHNLEFIREKNNGGKASRIDLIEAESNREKQYETYIRAENELANKKEELMLHVFGDTTHKITLSEDLGQLKPKEILESEEELIQLALNNRIERKKDMLAIEKASIELDAAAMDRWPDLNFEGETSAKGLESNFATSHQQMTGRDFPSWSTSLSLKQPIMRYAARGAHEVKTLRLQQERIKEEQTRRDITLEVRRYLRETKSGWIRIQALSKAAVAEADKYEGQSALFQAGKISNYDLNRALEDRQRSELELLEARITYKTSLAKLSTATGGFLKEMGLVN